MLNTSHVLVYVPSSHLTPSPQETGAPHLLPLPLLTNRPLNSSTLDTPPLPRLFSTPHLCISLLKDIFQALFQSHFTGLENWTVLLLLLHQNTKKKRRFVGAGKWESVSSPTRPLPSAQLMTCWLATYEPWNRSVTELMSQRSSFMTFRSRFNRTAVPSVSPSLLCLRLVQRLWMTQQPGCFVDINEAKHALQSHHKQTVWLCFNGNK